MRTRAQVQIRSALAAGSSGGLRPDGLAPSVTVRLILPDGLVTVLGVARFARDAIESSYMDAGERRGSRPLCRDDQHSFAVVTDGRAWSPDTGGAECQPCRE